jgi:hypothetical protein
LGINPDISKKPILFRGSSLIRGEQIARFLGGKYNPHEGYENDVRIYIKPKTPAYVKDGGWIDIVDGARHVLDQLGPRPNIKLIAYTELSRKFIKGKLPNKVVVIPEHHCNFERFIRTRKNFTTGGVVASPSPKANEVYGEIRKRLKKVGLKFITCFHFAKREDVVNFYKKIDFQVIGNFGYGETNPFGHPNKIINAASFGIPTLAFWKAGYEEFEGNYIRIQNLDEMQRQVEKLKNKGYYNRWSVKIRKAAEKYHIEHIAEKYKRLK